MPRPAPGAVEEAVAAELAAAHAAVEELAAGAEPGERAAAYGELGQLYAAYELWDAAQACFANGAALAPRAPRFLYYLGYVEQQRGAAAAAAAAFEQLLAVEPGDLAARLRLGEVRLDLGETAAAAAAFAAAVRLDPGAAAAHAGLGRARLAAGDAAAAARSLERALRLDPAAGRLHYLLGQAYRRLGRLEEARRELARRGEALPGFADPLVDELSRRAGGGAFHKFHGDQAMLAERWGEAAAAYRRAVAADPQDFYYRKSLGLALYRLGRAGEATAELQRALELAPDGPASNSAADRAQLHFALGGIAANRGDDPTARRHLEAAIGLDAGLADAHYELGNLAGRAGDLEAALAHFTAALAADPDHPGARLHRATTLMDLGRFADAIPDLERTLRNTPQDPRTRQLLAIARQRAGKD